MCQKNNNGLINREHTRINLSHDGTIPCCATLKVTFAAGGQLGIKLTSLKAFYFFFQNHVINDACAAFLFAKAAKGGTFGYQRKIKNLFKNQLLEVNVDFDLDLFAGVAVCMKSLYYASTRRLMVLMILRGGSGDV
jgi:hypothetical protein